MAQYKANHHNAELLFRIKLDFKCQKENQLWIIASDFGIKFTEWSSNNTHKIYGCNYPSISLFKYQPN